MNEATANTKHRAVMPGRPETTSCQPHSEAGPSAPPLASVIVQLPLTSVRPYAGNARSHSERQIKKLAGIIRTVGFLVPIIVDDADTIIAGHGRWAAAKQLGLQLIPAIRANHLTAPRIKAFRLADNRIGELSS